MATRPPRNSNKACHHTRASDVPLACCGLLRLLSLSCILGALSITSLQSLRIRRYTGVERFRIFRKTRLFPAQFVVFIFALRSFERRIDPLKVIQAGA
ncbi:hypothetical protein [Xanthomonas hortorum]|uniref:Uncharacterized protein n=1 Tax=Xanthomonas hortorum pv. hederae TaxID=453603 RepID=A0A9X3Z066_9XANT|nr:hypothetical protein [Xanthomonas hortorum]MCE4370850.1 hypothetical protein [Xanthomonas hortorum pv. hederae]MDC8637753.1 hypothetical protein [Xanthomonas hortorum pv. hederae]